MEMLLFTFYVEKKCINHPRDLITVAVNSSHHLDI
jgi:hypothetical protein